MFLFANTEPLYFVTFNCYKRISVLACSGVHEVFRVFCTKGLQHNVVVGRYVIMPDHVHLFFFMPPVGKTLPEWIAGLRTVMGKKLLALGVRKPHWQEGFFDHVLRNSESYAEKWNYVRMNPVRAGLSRSPEDWPYQGEITRLPFD